jgi:indole-3-glycerol phosphate synthase
VTGRGQAPRSTYLDRILEDHRAAAALDRRPLEELLYAARQMPPTRGFTAALRTAAAGELAVIAEVKRRSPSKGELAPALDAEAIARAYADGGAACLSVLTDARWFGGSAYDLATAGAAVTIPVLRKDFTVDRRDVCDARLMGADAILLIVAALDPAELVELHELARDLSLDVLLEVHDEAELERAVGVGADLIGVNQRDLVTFEVDTERAARLGAALPVDVVRVAESGIRDADDARRLADAGFHAVLVGESIVTATDPALAVTALRVPRQ